MRADDAILAEGPASVRRLVEDEALRARPNLLEAVPALDALASAR